MEIFQNTKVGEVLSIAQCYESLGDGIPKLHSLNDGDRNRFYTLNEIRTRLEKIKCLSVLTSCPIISALPTSRLNGYRTLAMKIA